MRERFANTVEAVKQEGDKLAKMLTAAGSDKWKPIYAATWHFHVQNQHGHKLRIDLRDADKPTNRKYNVNVSWPGGKTNQFNAPDDDKSFSCNYDRGTDGLAQTIQKRVMPHVRDHWQERLDAIAKVEADEDSRLAMIHRVEERFGRLVSGKGIIYGSLKTGVHTIQLNHDGTRGTVDLSRSSLPMELVFRLIDWLEENKAGD